MSEPEKKGGLNERQNRILARGRSHFVVVWGMGIWGLTTAFVFAFIMSLVGDMGFQQLLWISLILFPIGGFFWGSIMWRFLEKQAERDKQ